jgi:hypothetical protein
MHALPLLATLVDPYELLFRQAGLHPRHEIRFGDEPNPEARFLTTARRRSEPARPR